MRFIFFFFFSSWTGWSVHSYHSSFLSVECVLQSWPDLSVSFGNGECFSSFTCSLDSSEFADEGDFKCSGDLYAVDSVLKTEGSTYLPWSCKPLAGGTVLLPGQRWYLPITVTCTCTDSWIFTSPLCLLEVSFTIYILWKSDNWTKSKFKNLWDDSSCDFFFPLSFRPDCCKTFTFVWFSKWWFLLMTWSCSTFILFFSTMQCPNPAT